MAHKQVVKIETVLDPKDVQKICTVIGRSIVEECKEAQKLIKGKQYAHLHAGLGDAGEWALIVADVVNGHIKCVESLRNRVNLLDSAARDIWWPVIEEIEQQAAENNC